MNQDRPGKWSGDDSDHICASGCKVLAIITCSNEDEAIRLTDMIGDCVNAAFTPIPEKKED